MYLFKKCLIPKVFLLLIVVGKVYAQQPAIRNLVFEGAGIRGIAYAGVIEVLEEHDKLAGVQKVGGTSAGAITALLVSLGYTSAEITEIISSTRFNRFNDGRLFFPGGVARMNSKFGWYRGERFTNWLASLIEKKTGDPDITFEELSQRGYKDLYVTATCLNKQRLLVFSKETYPRMKVKNAVRASMSIPLYFRAVFIDSTGQVHRRLDHSKKLDVVVDGGITGNFPIAMFDRIQSDSNKVMHREPDPQTLGVRIDSDQQIREDAVTRELVPLEITNLQEYISAFYILILENLNRNELTEADWARTISISSVGISPRIKHLSREQKETLVSSGRTFTASYLTTRLSN